MDEWHCSYCSRASSSFEEIIDHSVNKHPNNILIVKQKIHINGSTYAIKSKNYQCVPSSVFLENKCISCIKESGEYKIKISPSLDFDDSFASPDKKIQRLSSTPLKPNSTAANDGEHFTAAEELDLSACFDDMHLLEHSVGTQTDDSCSDASNSLHIDDVTQSMINDIIEKIPDVLMYLKSAGQERTFLQYVTLLAAHRLPLNNIAYLLFLDVVQWFSNSNTHSMRYSETVKQFWNIGRKLFKGKFIRFMGGWKNQGQEKKGSTRPEESCINFAVPHRECLENGSIANEMKNLSPGIMTKMLEIVSSDDSEQNKTYKICVDGKKINSGLNQKHGDVDLWGYERPPTLKEEKDSLEEDMDTLQKLQQLIEKLQMKDVNSLCDVNQEVRNEISEKGKLLIQRLSERTKRLRRAKQLKLVTLEKVKSACTTEILRSKYSYALSAIRTYIYQINVSVSRLLKAVNTLGYMIAICNKSWRDYGTGSTCDFSVQNNYICLTGYSLGTSDIATSSLVKQRSPVWHDIRKQAKVTGSTCHDALGFRGLKKQKEHYQYVVNGKEKDTPSEESQKRMKHGTDMEINAVATLVSKVLPVYHPGCCFFEEGCEVVLNGNETFVVVSPDGSVRDQPQHKTKSSDEDMQTADEIVGIEIKCPYPGDLYRTPVHYEMPWYYVAQVLLEMYTLKSESLLYLTYSEESTTVFVVKNNPTLTQEILATLERTYGPEIPEMKRLNPQLKDMTGKFKEFCQTNVRFIAEVPSIKCVRKCKHPEIADEFNPACHNMHQENIESSQSDSVLMLSVTDLVSDLFEMSSTISEAYSVGRHIASEVLVFLISDLDRLHERERQHAVPIAYALKGYSMTNAVLRKMLLDVQQRCFDAGLYVPVFSFDGQWVKTAVRSTSDKPLTLLQLQKDVFAEARKRSKKDIVDMVKESNVVKAESFEDVVEQTVSNLAVGQHDNGFVGPIELCRAKNCIHMFTTSSSVKKQLQCKQKRKQDDAQKKEVESLTQCTALLDTCPPDVARELASEPDSTLLAFTSATVLSSNASSSVDVDDLEDLFTEENNENICVLNNPFDEVNEALTTEQNTVGDVESSNLHVSNDPLQIANKFSEADASTMLQGLQHDPKVKASKWQNVELIEFMRIVQARSEIDRRLTKYEIQVCLKTVNEKLKSKHFHFAVSWNKERLVSFLYSLYSGEIQSDTPNLQRRARKNAPALKTLCLRIVNNFPKHVLSCVYSECIFDERLSQWQMNSPFAAETGVVFNNITVPIRWYSMPEYVEDTYTYVFSMLDCHHLFVNARVKCCGTGLQERGIKRDAWVKVAEGSMDNDAGLSLALVNDLVDRQSNAFAQKTFSPAVEEVMKSNGDLEEAKFCHLLREWYEAEDSPGIDVDERNRRRLLLRDWLLEGVKFNIFPPYGLYVRGIPYVMFEGLLTNIERRIQVIPYVKSGAYNVRSLGSLEAENFFGEFQELDPKGSGVIRPEDIPKAIQTACELLAARLNPNRDFFMHTSAARVYPTHQLCDPPDDDTPNSKLYLTPSRVTDIHPRNHTFDKAERKRRKAKRKSGDIHKPAISSRGARTVREHHRCDESKILPHVRLGINFHSDV